MWYSSSIGVVLLAFDLSKLHSVRGCSRQLLTLLGHDWTHVTPISPPPPPPPPPPSPRLASCPPNFIFIRKECCCCWLLLLRLLLFVVVVVVGQQQPGAFSSPTHKNNREYSIYTVVFTGACFSLLFYSPADTSGPFSPILPAAPPYPLSAQGNTQHPTQQYNSTSTG